jgi:ectoine hydroxylase-related dioxygenase (phytanoyl-CoA dioxygenase family)
MLGVFKKVLKNVLGEIWYERVKSVLPVSLVKSYDYLQLQKKYQGDYSHCNPRARVILEHIDEHGWAVVPNYVDQEWCNSVIVEIENTIRDYPETLQFTKDDTRIYGFDHASQKVMDIVKEPFVNEILDNYVNIGQLHVLTLANKLVYNPEGKGSGQGWHRDIHIRTLKCMIYLNDVDETNGAFQILEGSHRMNNLVHDTKSMHLERFQTRLEDRHDHIMMKNKERVRTLTGKAGTMAIFDISCIHRGSPITNPSGNRYALTHYYYSPDTIKFPLNDFEGWKPLFAQDAIYEKIVALNKQYSSQSS